MCLKQGKKDPCKQPMDAGPCMAAVDRWYYNQETKDCQQFTYGGCQGNENNFSKQECEEKCLDELKSFGICGQPAEAGNCRARHQKWFFKPQTRKCETFYYGGCGGNSNNFDSKQQCETVCLDELTCNQKMDAGPCRGAFQMWYFNRDGKKCEPFTYGGCEGNSNRFETKAACDKKCNRGVNVRRKR
ncbi:Serine protease inhibitor 2 [Trichuris trichiura]|uniref:Serine protease inhibitor 2 n=1 Tax=Trichuris trichiura TaxID=36087 RepID=A0A077ZE21_TRITR|nr:Serine protease inhibitor 2 [Trichuris trichiura]